jgi:hypothetical protein
MNAPDLPSPSGPGYTGPATIGQILDRTFQLIRANLRLFVGIAGVPVAANVAVYAAMAAMAFIVIIPQFRSHPDPAAILRIFFPAMMAVTIPLLAIFAIYMAAACQAATQANLGVRVTFREAYDVACRRAVRYVWLLLLAYLIVEGPIFLLGGALSLPAWLMGFNKSSPSPFLFVLIPLVFIFYIAATVYAVLMALRLSLAFPASVVEGLDAWPAIKRSNRLTRGAKGRIFVVFLAIYVACYVFTLVAFAVFALLSSLVMLAAAAMHVHLASPLGYAAIGIAAVCALAGLFLYMALSWAAITTALSVLYHDQRLRNDVPPPALPAPGAPA